MRKLIIIAMIFLGCESENIEPVFNSPERWIDIEGARWTINNDEVIFNEVWLGYIIKYDSDSLNFVVEYKHINWFYEIEVSDGEWMNGYRYKTIDSDSMVITQNWNVLVKKF